MSDVVPQRSSRPVPVADIPQATVRREVTLPLRTPDGFTTTATAMTFDGLVDGKEHLALGAR